MVFPYKRSEPRTNMIPSGLPADQQKVYQILQETQDVRARDHVAPQPLIVFTDLAKDYDDLLAMVLYVELHRLGLVDLRGVIANLMPAEKRAAFGRGALDELNLPDVPVAIGSRGVPLPKEYPSHDYEFDSTFMADSVELPQGKDLLFKVCKDAMLKGEKITILCLSSLQDFAEFIKLFPNLLRRTVSNVVLQGGYLLQDGVLIPDEAAQNNKFDPDAARKVHSFLQDSKIPSMAFNKNAAFGLTPPLRTQLFLDMAATSNAIGKHLVGVQERQELEFYTSAALPPEQRFRPEFDVEHYLKRTNWYDPKFGHTKDTPKPVGREILQYCNVTAYDAIAAIGVLPANAIERLGLLAPHAKPTSIHQIVGSGEPGALDGTTKGMSTALNALLLGSLKAVQAGLPSAEKPLPLTPK